MSENVETTEVDTSLLGGAEAQAPAQEQGGEEAAPAADAADSADVSEAGEAELGFDVAELEAPDGFEMDEDTLKAAEPLFKELGLDKEGAQRLVGFYAERVAAMTEANAATLSETTEGWISEIKSEWKDSYDANVAIAAKAVDFGGDELREALNVTGAGNHPAVIKFFHKVGQSLSEDGFDGGKAAPAKPDDWVSGLYPSMQTPTGG